MVEEEAVKVLQVEKGKAKNGAKLIVKRACMGTQPKSHPFTAPVLAMPQMLSYRPGVLHSMFMPFSHKGRYCSSCSLCFL